MAAWDEDDHLLDDILDDDADGEVGDGWDEDLTGLSSDEEPAHAATDEAKVPGDTVNAESRPPSGAGESAVASDQVEKTDDNAWDFDEFEESSDDAAPPATADVMPSNDRGMSLNTDEAKTPSIVSEDATNQIDGRQANEWDFEDDLFEEDDKSSSAQMVEEKTEVLGFKPPPPPHPFTSNTVQQPSNPFLQQSVAQAQNNLFDTAEKQPESTYQTKAEDHQANPDDFGDNGWSDDEAFFDEGMEDLAPVAPNAYKSSPPPTQTPTPQQLTDPQLKIYNLLQSYLTNISSPHFLPRLHSKMNSSDIHTQGSNLREYYATRPGLKQYTLGVEMDRMDYTLITHDGRRVLDKQEIRNYFVSSPGIVAEEEQPTVDEVLIRSANQSLLADALILLTGSEDIILSNDEFFNNEEMSLILSGPLLCMTSIAETCKFVVDLMNGVVEATIFLAIGIPFHHGQAVEDETIVKDERLALARARVLVRFRPGSVELGEESTVQYVVESVEQSFSSPEVSLPYIRDASISLAMDHNDPFFQHDEVQDAGTEDVRDLFLLNHHLLSDSHLIAVSDHLVRLKGAAEASSTGFRSALRQLDGVTGVSGKLNMIKKATGGASHAVGIGGFLSLPSAQEIEAAEHEAANSIPLVGDGQFPRPGDVSKTDETRFPRPNDLSNQHATHVPLYGQNRPPPPPPPPPLPPQMTPQEDAARPRPLIGGMFLSGLSRLAAAATQPNEAPHLHHGHSESQPPAVYQNDDYAKSSYHVPQWDGTSGGTGLTPAHDDTSFAPPSQQMISHPETLHSNMNESRQDASTEEKFEDAHEMDGGWSDDGLDFEDDDQLKRNGEQPLQVIQAAPAESSNVAQSRPKLSEYEVTVEEELKFTDSKQVSSYPQATAKCRPEPVTTFEEEFVIVLKEKVEQEEAEMRARGKMMRWRPISEDLIRRQRLMEVMMVQLDGS